MSYGMASVYDGDALETCWRTFAARPANDERSWSARREALIDFAPDASQLAGDDYSTCCWLVLREVVTDNGRELVSRNVDEWGRFWP